MIVSEYDGADPSRPRYSIANLTGDRIDVFGAMNDDGDFIPSQAALKSAGTSAGSGNEYTVFFDENGLPERINDEENNRYLLIERMDGGTKFEMYDSANVFAGGSAILEDETGPKSLALIEGEPAFSGQLVGQLSGAVSGSFAVVAAPASGLGAATDLPPMIQSYLAVNPGSRSKAGTGTIADGVNAIIRTGAATYVVAGALAGGAALVVGAPIATAGAVAAATVAAVGFAIGLQAVVVRQGLQEIRDGIDEGEGRDTFDSIFGSFSANGSPQDFIDNARTEAQSIVQTGAAALGTLADRFVNRAGQAADTVAQLLLPSAQAQPVQGPPTINTPVSGFGVDSTDRQYEYDGEVGADGSISLNGTANSGATQVQINGAIDPASRQIAATYSGTEGMGAVIGSASEFGNCETVQNSGGQGSFSFVSDIGMVGGVVSFTYDAYSVPDAFTLRNGGAVVFSTGGVVSGAGSTSFTAASPIVFVNVSAPISGTGWEYALGCAS